MAIVPAPAPPLPSLHLVRGGAEPLHRQIERALRALILDDRWPSGSRLPPEPVLAADLGVNRGTLRRALAALTASGWLTAAPGRGTFVTDLAKPSIAQRFRSLSEDLTDQGVPFRTEVRAAAVVPGTDLSEPVRAALQLGNAPAFRLVRIFRGETGPLAYLVNTVPAADCPGIDTVDFATTSLFAALADRYGIAIVRGRRSFSARAADEDGAAALGLPVGAPVLHIDQVSYTADGDAVEHSDIWLNSEAVAVTSFLERDQSPSAS